MLKDCSLISVIVPCFNVESYIKRCLDSLFSSSYKNIEVICVDDGSTDETFSILKKYSNTHQNMKLLHNESNKGVGYSRNLALDNSSGDYVMFCDSDDFYSPDMIYKMFNTIISKKVDLAVCDMNIINDSSINLSKFRNLNSAFLMDASLSDKMKVNNTVILKTNRVLWNKIFKKSIIDKYKIRFPEELYMSEDACFFLEYLSCIKKVFFINEKLYTYCRRGDSVIGKRFDKNFDSINDCVKAHKFVIDFIKRNKIKTNLKVFEVSYLNEVEYAINLMNELLENKFTGLV